MQLYPVAHPVLQHISMHLLEASPMERQCATHAHWDLFSAANPWLFAMPAVFGGLPGQAVNQCHVTYRARLSTPSVCPSTRHSVER